MKNFLQVNRALAAEKKHLLFNQLFGTVGSPNQTGKTLTPSDERAMTERKPRGEKEQLSSTCLRSASELPPFRSRYLRYAAMIFAVLVMSVANISMAWGADYTKDDIGEAKSNITISIGGDKVSAAEAKVCNVTSDVIAINGSANGDYTDDYIEIKAASGYTLDSPIGIEGSVNKATKDGGGPYAVAAVFWTGDAAATFSSVTTIGLTYKDATTGCDAVSLSVPSGTRTVRLYRAMKHTSNTFNGSGTQEGAGQTAYIKTITATASAASSCSAPNHVDVSGDWHIFPGDDMTMTARAYSTTGTTNEITSGLTYQWQKYVGSDFEDIEGATSATYTKNDVGVSDAGQYRCLVSTSGTIGDGCTTASAADAGSAFKVKCLELLVYYNDNSFKHRVGFTKVDATHATASVLLENGSYMYTYKITDSQGKYWGNNGSGGMSSGNCTNWDLTQNNDYYTRLWTSKSATYVFNLTYDAGLDNFKMSVVFPSTVQTADYPIYFDNSDRGWSNVYYRIGRNNYNSKEAMTLVPGTAHLYQGTTIGYAFDGGFEAWHIANNGGWTGGNSIYKTKNLGEWTITEATRFEGAPIPSGGITVIPGSDHTTGGTTGSGGDTDNANNNCEFYSFTTVPGMWTHNVSITPPSHGTLTVNYITTTNEPAAFNSGNRDLAHTANYCVTAEEGIGYTVASITINGTPVENRSWHVLTEDVVVAATFTLADYTITHSAASNGTYTIKVGDAAAVNTNTTANYGQTVTLAASPSEGYELSSWTVTKAGGGTVDVVSNQFSMPNDNVTITATFALKTYTITYNAGTGDITGSHANDTKTHGVNLTLPGATFSKTGYTQTGWATSDGGSQAYALSASYTANAAANLYPVWTAKTTAITLDKNNSDESGSTSGSVTATYGSSSLTSLVDATRTGYTIDGYQTEGKVKIIKADGTLNSSKDGYTSGTNWIYEGSALTLYAVWKANKFNVTHTLSNVSRSSGGEVGSDKATYGTAYSVTFAASSGYTLPDAVTVTVGGSNVTANCTWNQGTGVLTIPAAYVTGNIVISVTGVAAVVSYATSIDFEAFIDRRTTSGAWKDTIKALNYTLTQADGSKWTLDNPEKKPADKGLKIKETGDNAGKITFTVRANQTVELKVGTLAGTNSGTAKFSTDGGSSYSDITGAATASTGASVVTTYTGATDRTYVFKTSSASWNILQHIIIGYKITYDKGANGTGTINPMYKTHGTNITLSSSTFTYAGHTQDGWSTSDGGSKVYELGASYTTDAPVTLYPHWVEDAATISATLESDTYMRTGASGMELSVSITGASSGWYYRVKNTSTDGYQTPDLTTYTTTSWIMTSTIGAGANSYVVELYNGSGTKMATSNTITVNGETGHPMTINAGAGGSVSPSGLIYANGDHLHPEITATPSSGYHFVNWDLSNSNATLANANAATTTITNASGACTITANFAADATLYTVTYNAQGGSVTPSSETVSTATLPTPTKSGYTFDGWYTSGGSKITGTYNPTADITLYAQWQSTDCDAGGTTTLVDINFKDASWSGKTFSQANDNNEDFINGVYFWSKDASKHFSLADNTSNGLTFPNNNMSSGTYYLCIPITGINSSNKQITVTLKHGYSSAQAEYKWAYADGRTSFSDGNTGGSGGTKVQDASKASTEMTFTKGSLSNTSGHLFIGRSSSSYPNIYGVTVTTPGAAGTCYYVTYNGNGATGGYTTDEAAYASGDNATAATNSFTKTGYTFKEWRTNANGTGTKYEAGDPIVISGNITLYAIWQEAAGYTLAWNTNGGSALAGDYSSGSFADGVAITAPTDPTRANYTFDSWNTAGDGTGNAYIGTMPAANTTYYAVWKNTLTLKTGSQGSESDKSPTVFLDGSSLNGFSAHKAAGYTLQGYYTAATGGTKVLNADGSFAASNIARFVTSGKWSRTTGDTILVAQWESSYLLKWNLQLDKAEDAISTTSKESATARITTASMTNLTNNGGLTITGSKKSNLTSQIETPINLSVAESKYMSVSFDVTAGYQLLPSAVKVMVQPVGNGENKYAKLILVDEYSHSISTVVECEGTEKGKKTTVTLSNAGGTVFTGTVTLKILVYNKSGASTGTYRLGSPIQIDGAIEAACDLPSYEGLEYDQTEYTVGVDEASAIRVTGGSANTYQWKWNSTNDRSTGTEVGANDASYTPTISEVGTRYYWCELTNDDCDGVVKTPAVAITVRANKSDASVTWTDPANEPNYGGGGYVIRATMNSGYDGELSAEDLTAPAGIRITNVSIDNKAAQKYIEATFDVTTAFNRDENSKISFTLSHDATTGYEAISDEHEVDYDACSGGEEGSAAIALTSAIHDEGSGNAPRYWFETSGVGRVFGLNYGKATLGTSSDAAFSTEGYSYVASSTSQRWVFQPYVEGVNKIRIYIKSATNTLKVLSIGKNASWQDQSGKYSNIAVDTIIYSNDKTTGLDNNQKGYAEIQFSSALTKNNYYMITMSSSSTYIYGVTLYSGSVGDGGNLPTSLTFANTGPIAANASTANFQNIASKSGENRNTLGTITYSSNNDAATVNATTGEVSIHAKETAQTVTITATLSASGCYQGATATYTINVAANVCDEPSGSIELTSGGATKCSGESVILTMTGFTSGATVEWYNGNTKVNDVSGYTIATSGSTSTLTTSNAGTYSAIAKVAGGCASGAGRTNSITISNISVDASATKIVDKWYVKNGRLTPDIALWQLGEGATFDEVTIERNVSGEGTLGLTSSDFVARDGIVYLSGKEPSTNDTGADIEYTLTLKVKDACDDPHEMTEKTITLTHQKNTDKHVLAFVVNGTAKGGFTEGITAPQTTGVSLYNTIAAQFDVQATNIYATDDEKKLKEYYSQYDILCITDYPNTQTKGANSKSYVDAIGSLIDIRPILTMEAFVSKLENWKVKGISGNPKSPSTRQYTMLLQCKDHEIFAQTKLTTIGEGDETMYRVSMVDSTKEDYATLDATYGAILPHKEKESKKGAGDAGYNYGGKPALQGFTFTQEMSDNDLLPIGLIDDGAGNPLQVGIERQHNMEARLMVLGINSYAMERLTNDGERVVINALNYLMKKNAEDIADCSTSFVGGAEGEETNWNNADNWTGNTVPDKTQKVRILAPCVVPAGVKAHVAGVLIAPNGKYNREANIAEGSLTIAAGGALVVDGKIQAVTAPAYNRPRATTPADLAVLTSADAQGALIFDNSEGETQATVQMYSKATTSENTCWQYMGIPMESLSPAQNWFYNAWMMKYTTGTQTGDEALYSWEYIKTYDELNSFNGYALTQEEAKSYWLAGALAETGVRELPLSNAGGNGWNLYANSWTAPINIAALESSDFVNADATIYLYNTGSRADWDIAGDDAISMETTAAVNTAGQYLSVPVGLAEYVGTATQIPAMQGFFVQGNHASAAGSLTLDYDKVVRTTPTEKMTTPLRAPRRAAASKTEPEHLTMIVQGSSYGDVLHLFRSDEWTDAYDNGYDAHKVYGDDYTPQLAAGSPEEELAVVATDELEGTQIRFRAGTHDSEYTIRFLYNSEDESLYLYDIQEQTYTRVETGASYTFTASDKNVHTRFVLTRNAPQIATGVGEVPSDQVQGTKAKKLLIENKMFIMVNGMLYDATGKVVK